MSDISTLAQGLGLTNAQLAQLEENLATLKINTLLALDEDVARAKQGARLTKAGLDIIAQGNAGAQVQYRSVWLGDAVRNGSIVTPSDNEILNMTALINPVVRADMISATHTGNGTFTIKFLVTNAESAQGFWLREIGLFATDPATGSDVLYCYKNNGLLATYVPPNDGAVSNNLIISLVTVIDQASNVTAVVSTEHYYVNESRFSEHLNDTNPHPNFLQKKREVTSSDYYWAAGSDQQLHTISKSNMQLDLLGGSISDISNLSNRIGQNEMNIANLYAQLRSQLESGLSANLLLIEDFTTGGCIDNLTMKVETVYTGTNNIGIESLDGILEGHYYTISDGKRSEYVRVQSVSTNMSGDSSACMVFFESNLKKNYTVKNTKLYRSTSEMSENLLTNISDTHELVCNFSSYTWQGYSSGQEKILKTPMVEGGTNSPKCSTKAGRFTDYTLDGYFTLSIDDED